MDPISRVTNTAAIVIREREALDVQEQAAPKHHQQPLAGVGAKQQGRQLQELVQERDRDEEQAHGDQERSVGLRGRSRKQRVEDGRRGLRADDAVDSDLEWNGKQQGQRRRQEAEESERNDARGVGPHLAQEPNVDARARSRVGPSEARARRHRRVHPR